MVGMVEVGKDISLRRLIAELGSGDRRVKAVHIILDIGDAPAVLYANVCTEYVEPAEGGDD